MSDPVCKLILVGNGSVGKSSIIARFVADGFEKQYKQTIGLDFYEKKLLLPRDKRVVLEVWDIGGQNINSKMLGKYIYGADIVFICYDVTDAKSFADVEDWLVLVQRSMGALKKQQIYAVGNKIDLVHLRAVPEQKHNEFIAKHKLAGGFLLSAHNGDNVMRTVHQIAARAVGMELSEFELQFYDAPVKATVVADSGEHRTAMADEIEAEDLKLEMKKRQKKSCHVM
ncbi:Rab28 family GTPase [Thraustotheca clavata]|uniref:Rab28 family GTPase n=1 Tax=Thraustotheca clavata TaxID=74557 RepID=A0A1V9ZBP9_9STRA|nr:Rab28 family GTPase [Thraustotheca clavata]